MSDTPLGRFCWFDLMTSNPDEAPDFYRQILNGPLEVPGGDVVAQCLDPQGAAFAIHAAAQA